MQDEGFLHCCSIFHIGIVHVCTRSCVYLPLKQDAYFRCPICYIFITPSKISIIADSKPNVQASVFSVFLCSYTCINCVINSICSCLSPVQSHLLHCLFDRRLYRVENTTLILANLVGGILIGKRGHFRKLDERSLTQVENMDTISEKHLSL